MILELESIPESALFLMESESEPESEISKGTGIGTGIRVRIREFGPGINRIKSLSLNFWELDHYLKPWQGNDRLESEPESRFFLDWNWNGISGLLAGIGIGTEIRLFNFPGIVTGIRIKMYPELCITVPHRL